MDRQTYRTLRAAAFTAYYTSPEVTQSIWNVLHTAGLQPNSTVLEPGCGTGNFIGTAPRDVAVVGVEKDPIAAAISTYLYPHATIEARGFETLPYRDNTFTAAIGNVPFSDEAPYDPIGNEQHFSTHNYFIVKSLKAVQDGGYAAFITSSYTSDAAGSEARSAMIDEADLVTAVRLPEQAFTHAGTSVTTDLLIFRKRPQDTEPTQLSKLFEKTDILELDDSELRVNAVFTRNPASILGTPTLARDRFGKPTLKVTGDRELLPYQIIETAGSAVRAAAATGHEQTAPVLLPEQFQPMDTDTATATLPGSVRVHGVDEKNLPVIEQFTEGQWVTVSGSTVPQRRRQETAQLIEIMELSDQLQTAYRDVPDATTIAHLQVNLETTYDTYVSTYGPVLRSETAPAKKPSKAEQQRIYTELAQDWRLNNGIASTDPLPVEVEQEFRDTAAQKRATGEKIRPHLKLFVSAPGGLPALTRLEKYDESTGTASKQPFLFTNPTRQARPLAYTDSLEKAFTRCMTLYRAVDVDYLARVTDEDREFVEQQLVDKRLAFRDPTDPDVFIPVRTYLSGRVYDKLEQAQHAAEVDGRFTANVEELKGVLPPRIEDVTFKPGVTWIPTDIYKDFLVDQLGVSRFTVDNYIHLQFVGSHGWTLEYNSRDWHYGRDADLKYGVVTAHNAAYGGKYNFLSSNQLEREFRNQGVATTRSDGVVRTALDTFAAALNMQSPELHYSKAWKDEHPGSHGVHETATQFARLKTDQIIADFDQWVKADEDRHEFLLARYNELFNERVTPVWDGTHRDFEGLGSAFKPYAYQANAVERIVSEPSVLLNHVVGAGKTGTMFMAAMELKKAGIVNQPWIVMPNQVAESMAEEITHWYPTARVLSGAGLHGPQERAEFIMQSIAGDWDIVLCPMSVFGLIPMGKDKQIEYLEVQQDLLEQALTVAQAANADVTEQQIQSALHALYIKVQTLIDKPADPNHEFEATKCDYLFIDEAHNYKNLFRWSTINGVNHPGSQRATDLDMKIDYLRSQKQPGTPTVTFATGTPISNNIAEMWVMAHYLRPDLLQECDIDDVQQWASTFTKTTQNVELNASGSDMRTVTRLGAFNRVNDFARIIGNFVDVVTKEQLEAELPNCEVKTIRFEPEQDVQDFIADLEYRQEHEWVQGLTPRQKSSIDNVLKIITDGKKATLHPGLVGLNYEGYGARVEAVADNIFRIWEENKDNEYRSVATGEISPHRGGFQMVFSDTGVNPPRFGGSSVYDALRKCLEDRGMDPNRIRVVGEWDDNREALYQDCREGHVDVLIGSTSKLGTGVNIQTRATALHHLDVPPVPASLEQREGRLMRQGNQNDHVEVYRYVAAGTFDQFDWQTIERKATFIEQIGAADANVRDIEMKGESQADQAALLKAVSSPDKRILDLVTMEQELKELNARYGEWKAKRQAAKDSLNFNSQQVNLMTSRINALEKALPHVTQWIDAEPDERTYRRPDGKTLTSREDAAAYIYATVHEAFTRRASETTPLVTIAGVQYDMMYSAVASAVKIYPAVLGSNADNAAIGLNWEAFKPLSDPKHFGFLARIDNGVKRLPIANKTYEDQLAKAQEQLRRTDTETGTTFEDADRLEELTIHHDALAEELKDMRNSEAARRIREERAERNKLNGRQDGWTLRHSPTTGYADFVTGTSTDQVVWDQLTTENETRYANGIINEATYTERKNQLGPSPADIANQQTQEAEKAEQEAQKARENTQNQGQKPTLLTEIIAEDPEHVVFIDYTSKAPKPNPHIDGRSLSKLVGMEDCHDQLTNPAPQAPDSSPQHKPQEQDLNQNDQRHNRGDNNGYSSGSTL